MILSPKGTDFSRSILRERGWLNTIKGSIREGNPFFPPTKKTNPKGPYTISSSSFFHFFLSSPTWRLHPLIAHEIHMPAMFFLWGEKNGCGGEAIPRCSMYGVLFTYIYPLKYPNVGK